MGEYWRVNHRVGGGVVTFWVERSLVLHHPFNGHPAITQTQIWGTPTDGKKMFRAEPPGKIASLLGDTTSKRVLKAKAAAQRLCDKLNAIIDKVALIEADIRSNL